MSEALRVVGVSKRFGPNHALVDVSMSVDAGEIRALVGENGAGKSTLVKILSGYHLPDQGQITVGGKPLSTGTGGPRNQAISIVHQDLGLDDDMSVWENLGVGVQYGRRLVGPISKSHEIEQANRLAREFSQRFDGRQMVSELQPAERTMVAILRAVRRLSSHQSDGRLLVLDEPAASLFGADVTRLIALIRQVAEQGTAVLIVEHHLQHVLDVADSVTVLRSGRLVGTYRSAALSIHELVSLMLGPDAQALSEQQGSGSIRTERPEIVLQVRGLEGKVARDLTFDARAGEIVGFTGLSGMGHEEVPYLLAGAVPRLKGTVRVGGTELGAGVRSSKAARLVLVPDRRKAIWMDGTALENMTVAVLRDLGPRLLMKKRRQEARVKELMNQYEVSPRVVQAPMRSFSGGNQQKLLLGKWTQTRPLAVVLDGPTKGVDVGGRLAILRHLGNLAHAGCAVVLCSEDAEELVQVCDRVIILNQGRITEELCGSDMTVSQILSRREMADA